MTMRTPFMTLVAATALIAPATAAADSYWMPLDLHGGQTYTYRYTEKAGGKSTSMTLTFAFTERADYKYDVDCKADMTLSDGPRQAHTSDRRVALPSHWLNDNLKQPPSTAAADAPRTLLLDLANVSRLFFVDKDAASWKKGFTMQHPNPSLGGATFTATAKTCKVAGIAGRILKVEGAIGTFEACVSPKHGLPLSLTRKGAGHESIHTLQKFEARPLKRKAVYARGVPTGYDGIAWGTPVEKVLKEAEAVKSLADSGMNTSKVPVHHLTKAQPLEGGAVYTPKNRTEFGATWSTVELGFPEGKLAWVRLTGSGIDTWDSMLGDLVRWYGSPSLGNMDSPTDADSLTWSHPGKPVIEATYRRGSILVRVYPAKGNIDGLYPD